MKTLSVNISNLERKPEFYAPDIYRNLSQYGRYKDSYYVLNCIGLHIYTMPIDALHHE